MLEKPDLPDDQLIACIRAAYGWHIAELTFLPLGADQGTAVYRARAADGTAYFVKLRRGFEPAAVTLPAWLHAGGIEPIIAPLATTTGAWWAQFEPFALIVYPFIAGEDGFHAPMTADHWHTLGRALKRIHTAPVPPELAAAIPRETFEPRWRNSVASLLDLAESTTFAEPVAAQCAALLQAKQAEVRACVARAETLAQVIQGRNPAYVLCHADLHAGNILIDTRGQLYIVDWDTLLFAPKERDLMFIGGGQGFKGHTADEETTLFYQGYGATPIDGNALAYYRYERIIQDIAAYGEQLLLGDEGGDDRPQALEYLGWNFLPGGTLERAAAADAGTMTS